MAAAYMTLIKSNHTKAPSNSDRAFSKLTRSPTSSRSDRTSPSIHSQGSDGLTDYLPAITASSRSHTAAARPELLRNTSAPVATPTTNLPRDAAFSRTRSDESGTNISQSNTAMLDMPAAVRSPGSGSSKLSASTGMTDGTTPQLPPLLQGNNLVFQQFTDITNKRIATLKYLQKSHEGKMFWFNTVQFTRTDISRFPAYAPSRLHRRAMSFLLLGLSIPAVLEVHPQPHPSNTPTANSVLALEYLRTLNTLFTEFESYQQLHPIDGSHVSSLTRARIPQMFKRAATTGRPRKSSGAPNVELSITSQLLSPATVPDSSDTSSGAPPGSVASTIQIGASPASGVPPAGFSTSSSFPPSGPPDAPNSTLIPNEGPYTHLLTPPLPFTPDFYTVFATLCDVLIDIYQRLLQIIHQPSICSALVGESFSRTDAKIRKVMVAGIVKDFDSVARDNAKKELLGVQKVVLGGLMGGG